MYAVVLFADMKREIKSIEKRNINFKYNNSHEDFANAFNAQNTYVHETHTQTYCCYVV